MERVSTFLESSTIHGLAHISTTRKYARLFWILVVFTGFLGASLLIKESFDSWSESPVRTTIETLPISEIKLPRVTVCPPKKIFTDLNYDLMMTENVTLSDELRDEMFRYAIKVINEEDEESFQILAKLYDENRFYNWYHGFEMVGAYDDIYTHITSGVITTQYYGDKFQPGLVERKLRYVVRIYPPRSGRSNDNVTLHFKVEKVSMRGLNIQEGSQDAVKIIGQNWILPDQTTVYVNFTPPGWSEALFYARDVSSEDVEQLMLDVMPGFKFSWWYTGAEVEPEMKNKDDKMKNTLSGECQDKN